MKVRLLYRGVSFFFTLLLTANIPARAQVPTTGTLRGQVIDPSGSTVSGAAVLLTAPNGNSVDSVTNKDGFYEVTGLAPGTYTVKIVAEGLGLFTASNIAVKAGQTQTLKIALTLEEQKLEIHVEDSPTQLDVNPESNASSIVIKGKDLEALSDDPDELQQELQALAGPSAGPNGGQIYIDGFTAGQLPPKSSIREIRINQNPFSAEYDKLGYGRIEIFTKPGTDKFHGQFMLMGNSSDFDALSPFAPNQPSFHTDQFEGSVSGPLGKKASFFFNAERRQIGDANIVNALVPTTADPNPTTANFTQAVPNPRTRTEIGPRLDFQLSPSNTLTVRYQFYRNSEDNQGVGQFSLPSQAYNTSSTEHTLQISDTQVVSTNVVNETRFQYLHDNSSQMVQNFQPTIYVLAAFTGGGNRIGNGSDAQNHYELQNYTSIVHANHLIKFGGRLRATTDSNVSNSYFNGAFTFSSLTAYENNVADGTSCLSLLIAALPTAPTPGGLAQCGASQFSIHTGEPR